MFDELRQNRRYPVTLVSMAAPNVATIPWPRSIFNAVGFKYERDAARYDKRFCQFEHSVEQSSSSSSEEEDVYGEEIEGSVSLLASLLAELEYLSLIFKLWLRRINQKEGTKRHQRLQDFEHAIHLTRESVLKPYKNFLLSNQYKEIEELLSEPLMQFYCQCLEEKCNKILIEKEKANFEMTEQDRIMINRETVHTCSFLGLKLDFLDRLEDMPLNICEHRTLSDWVVIFLQNNYSSLGFTEKDSLDKHLLDVIGFDPLSSTAETILARARNMPQHINACEWAEIFIKDEFKYNPLFSEQNARFPLQSYKTNEWFKLPMTERNSQDKNDVCQVNIVNVVTKESEPFLATAWLPRNLEDEQHTLLFHGTDHESAIDILSGRGIHLPSGRQKRDFSSGKGFYLTNNVSDALSWASSTTAKPAILVFRVNGPAFLNSKTRKLTLTDQPQGLEIWREVVNLFRSGKRSAKTQQILTGYDLIEGPLARAVRRRGSSNESELVFEPKPASYQMCLISDDLAESFEQNLHSILFFEIRKP